MTNFEKAFQNMTPAQRKKVSKQVSDMMGMPPKKKSAGKSKKRK